MPSALLVTLVACASSAQDLGHNEADVVGDGADAAVVAPVDSDAGSEANRGSLTSPEAGSEAGTSLPGDPFTLEPKPALTKEELDAYLASQTSSDGTLVGSYRLFARKRSCPSSGCEPWQTWSSPTLLVPASNPPSDPPSETAIPGTGSIHVLGSRILFSSPLAYPEIVSGNNVLRLYFFGQTYDVANSDGSVGPFWVGVRSTTDPFTAKKVQSNVGGGSGTLFFPPEPGTLFVAEQTARPMFSGRVYKDGTIQVVTNVQQGTTPAGKHQLAIVGQLTGM